MVNVDVGMAAARNGAPMARLNKDGTAYVGGNLWPIAEIHKQVKSRDAMQRRLG